MGIIDRDTNPRQKEDTRIKGEERKKDIPKLEAFLRS